MVTVKTIQKLINEKYSDKEKTKIIEIIGNHSEFQRNEGVTENLTLENYPNLEAIKIVGTFLTELKISNCPKLKEIDLDENHKLNKLEIVGCPKIKSLTLTQVSKKSPILF